MDTAPTERGAERRPLRASGREGGFTMVEVIIASGIMVILMGIGSFAIFSYWRAQALSGATTMVATDMRDAKVRAQAEVRNYRIVFVDTKTYQIQRLPDALGVTTTYTTVETKTLERDVILDFSSIGICSPPDPAICIDFTARGTSTGGTFRVLSQRLEQDRHLVVNTLTGRIEVR